MKTILVMKSNCLLLLLAWMLQGCSSNKEIIMTVNGPVDAATIGTTLAHEHFLVDFIGADSTGYHRWNRDTVIAKVLPFLLEARDAGVITIVECTPAYLGRDPVLLQELSRRSGLNILTNTGYYGAINNKALPQDAFVGTADQMAEIWIREWQQGIELTGIKPGFIKIAVEDDSVLAEVQEKIVRAAAKAHLKTGLVINAHTGPDLPALAEVRILKEEGVDPSAFIWTHAQGGTGEIHVKLAKEGAWISLDNVMTDNIDQYVAMLMNMKQQGVLHRALISHDAGWYDVIQPDSVTFRGYTALFTHLKPALLHAGFTENDWAMLTEKNPAEAYQVKIRKLQTR